MSSNNTPDLASVLRTLAGFAPQSQQQGQVPPQAWPPNARENHNITPASATKVIDPATIIDWSAGLRCVMKLVARHDNILQDVRRMIKVQHEHEEQWWKGREALRRTQEARKDGQQKLDEVLRLVGGTVSSGSSNTSPEEMAKELVAFDMKVYRAQTQMVAEMTARLRGHGIPFFGTKAELIRVKGKAEEKAGEDGSHAPKDENRTVDEADLVELQRKMLALLEDLCRD